MKICKVISSFGHGKGGHFFDVFHITKELHKTYDIDVLNIGLTESPVIKKITWCNTKFITKSNSFIRYLIEIFSFIKKNKYHIIHCYDSDSFYLLRLMFPFKKITFSKCGGPIPNKIFPNSENIIVMSYDDYNFYNKMKITPHFIPNRVNTDLLKNKDNTDAFLSQITNNKTSYLRIIRITSFYEESINQFIDFCLKTNDNKSVYCLIGTIEDNDVYNRLKLKLINFNNLFILSENNYTENASKWIHYFDVIYGTGRGVMEASMQGKSVITYTKENKFPILMTPERALKFLKTNFSERNSFHKISLSKTIEEIYTYKNLDILKTFSDEYFNVKNASIKFKAFYKKILLDNRKYYFKNLIGFVLLIKKYS